MQRIIYKNTDNSVAIIMPSQEYLDMFDTKQEAMKALQIKYVPKGLSSEIVETSSIPSDRTFRNAWIHDTSTAPQKIGFDIAKAKDIAHTKRRADRAEAFKPLDIEATIPSKATQAETSRQTIRDNDASKQISIDACTNVTKLKEFM